MSASMARMAFSCAFLVRERSINPPLRRRAHLPKPPPTELVQSFGEQRLSDLQPLALVDREGQGALLADEVDAHQDAGGAEALRVLWR